MLKCSPTIGQMEFYRIYLHFCRNSCPWHGYNYLCFPEDMNTLLHIVCHNATYHKLQQYGNDQKCATIHTTTIRKPLLSVVCACLDFRLLYFELLLLKTFCANNIYYFQEKFCKYCKFKLLSVFWIYKMLHDQTVLRHSSFNYFWRI